MRGIVAAGGIPAATAGAEALRRGGNAADAAVAATFAAFTAEPCLTSPGGAGIALVVEGGRAQTYDFFAAVPGLPGTRLDPTGRDFVALEVDFGSARQTFRVGKAATAVPGCLPGLLGLHRLHGRLALADLLELPIRLARDGTPASAMQAKFIGILEPILTYTPGVRALFAASGRPVREGEPLASPAFAAVLERLAADGRDPLASGPLRDALLRAWGSPEGFLTAADLDAYRPASRPALTLEFRGHRVHLPGDPSDGGAMVGLALGLLQGRAPADSPRSALRMAALGAAVEAATLARAAGGGVPPRPDDPDVRTRWRPTFEALLSRGTGASPGPGPGAIPGNTTHVSAVDEEGRAVAITTTNGESCGVVLPELGLAMNNFLGEDDINPRGFHQDPPGMRMRTMMCPTVVEDAEGRLLALGTGGSNRIRSALVGVVEALLDHGLDPAEAVALPRLHREPGRGWLEARGLAPGALEALRAGDPGLKVFPDLDLFFGGVHVACLEPGGGLSGAGDPRRGGAVAGVR